MQWRQHWACRHQYGISQGQMPSRFLAQGPQTIKPMRLEDSKSRRKRTRSRQVVDGDQRVEMRGRGKGATANIAIGIGTAAGAGAGRDVESIGGEIETTRANRLHAVTAGLIGAGAAAGDIGGKRETDTVKGLQTDGGASALNGGGVIDKHYRTWVPVGSRR